MITGGDDEEVEVMPNQRLRTTDSAQQSNSSMARNVDRGPKRAKDSKKASTSATETVNLRKQDGS